MISVEVEEPSGTSTSVSGTSTSTSVTAPTPDPFARDPDFNTKSLFLLIKKNLKARRKAGKCDEIEHNDLFFNKTTGFLNQWQTITGVPGETNQTSKQVLERLVVYQAVYQTVRQESVHNAFPDNIIDQIRSIGTFVHESGALTAGDPRVIEALDIIFDDVCADTGETQVPARVQQMADVVQRGLSVNP
ncbi:hypothetical protein PG984_003001 [Apiospora sp. TS-2023a]